MIEAAAAADLLIHEATFLEAEAERARQTGHTTALQAARIGRDAQVEMLALTHLSTRYLPRDIRDEARAEFPNTVVPRDFDTIELPLPERGEPAARPRRWLTRTSTRVAGDYDRLRTGGGQWQELADRTLAALGTPGGCSTSAAAPDGLPCTRPSSSAHECGRSTRRPRCSTQARSQSRR